MAVITIKNVNIEVVKKGRNSYEKATVEYTDEKGDTKSKPVVSFSNPAVFAVVKDSKPGDRFNARSVEKDGYWNWAELTPVTRQEATPAKGSYVDNRETADERRMRQLMIVRQSSISNALEFLKLRGDNTASMEDVLSTAQDFVDFVYGTEEALGAVDREDQDIPY